MTQLTIHIDLDTMSKEGDTELAEEAEEGAMTNNALTDLATIIRESQGNTQLSLYIRDSQISPLPVKMVSRLPGIKVNRRLVDFIRSHEGMRFSL